MSYKLSIVEQKLGLNFNVKYENLAKMKKPEVEAKAPDGSIVKERTTYQGQVLPAGSTNRQWCDDKGQVYQKSQLSFTYNGEPVQEKEMTKTFNVQGYQDLKNYTDSYVIGTYYELFPSDNDMKKDFDKDVARITNMSNMRKLWEHLHANKLVARGEFCTSSKGFTYSDGYIRAVEFGNKWGLEIGVFKEEKIFEHLQEEVPQMPVPVAGSTRKLKMV